MFVKNERINVVISPREQKKLMACKNKKSSILFPDEDIKGKSNTFSLVSAAV